VAVDQSSRKVATLGTISESIQVKDLLLVRSAKKRLLKAEILAVI
jgi:hypothetical protein